MWSCGREVRVGTTRGKDVYLDHTLPCPDPAGQHQGCPRPRPVTSLFSQVPRVRTQPGGGCPEQCHPLPGYRRALDLPHGPVDPREGHGAHSPRPITCGSQIGMAILLTGLDNLFEELQDTIWFCPKCPFRHLVPVKRSLKFQHSFLYVHHTPMKCYKRIKMK